MSKGREITVCRYPSVETPKIVAASFDAGSATQLRIWIFTPKIGEFITSEFSHLKLRNCPVRIFYTRNWHSCSKLVIIQFLNFSANNGFNELKKKWRISNFWFLIFCKKKLTLIIWKNWKFSNSWFWIFAQNNANYVWRLVKNLHNLQWPVSIANLWLFETRIIDCCLDWHAIKDFKRWDILRIMFAD